MQVVLSSPVGASADADKLLRIKARPVLLRSGWKLSVVECSARREVVRNHEMEAGFAHLAALFEGAWAQANLFTLTGDFHLRRGSDGRESVRKVRPAFTRIPDPAHDKPKPARAELSRQPFLEMLGVTLPDGKPRAAMSGKLRQVARFVELLGHLFEECEWAQEGPGRVLKVADMGAGKGYLTFALAWMLRERRWPAEVLGIEARADLVRDANELSKKLGWSELRFEQGSIQNWLPDGGVDVLVALHACDTATDEALFQGVRSKASLIVTSPCCHKQVRAQIVAPEVWNPVMRHGILKERFAEILTDTVRASLLEREGYQSRVFEFVEPEHSGKNLMLAAIQKSRSPERVSASAREIETLLGTFGIHGHRLVQLLNSH